MEMGGEGRGGEGMWSWAAEGYGGEGKVLNVHGVDPM